MQLFLLIFRKMRNFAAVTEEAINNKQYFNKQSNEEVQL